jgi:enamine deaminase RidA (YjgF/YER057c/UK114 family)
VKVGNVLEVTGTVATDANGVVGKGDCYQQTKFVLQKIESVVKNAGFSLKDVVRTRIFVTDISKWEEVGKAHAEFFKTIKPCTTMVEVSALIDPDYLVEIEATAILTD